MGAWASGVKDISARMCAPSVGCFVGVGGVEDEAARAKMRVGVGSGLAVCGRIGARG
ncbi:MAG: hypothetical protein KA214_01880 [Neisseriaceae bacterium]|nr:hypothetical protein [Neisseriaceae bacterium]